MWERPQRRCSDDPGFGRAKRANRKYLEVLEMAVFRPTMSLGDVPDGPYAAPSGEKRWHAFNPLALSMSGMTLELWLIVAYLVVTGVADLRAGKLGFQAGPVPVFLTDMTLFALLAVSFFRWPSRILYWFSEGIGAGSIGRAVWLLCMFAVVYFTLAFARYPLYAARDLAIFCYSLYFPLTLFAIRKRHDAERILRYFTYAGVISALLLLLQETVGLDLGLFTTAKRFALGHEVLALRNGDASLFSILSLVSLFAYIICERRLRRFHIACAVVCFSAFAAALDRSGVVAVLFALGISIYCVKAKYRVRYVLLAALFALPVVLAPLAPPSWPGVKVLRAFQISVVSAAGGPSVDANAKFRTTRWKYASELWFAHPLFGGGFGRAIIPSGLVDAGERKGRFNAGMPHNSFLFVAARMGLVGLGLVVYCWLSIVTRLAVTFGRTHCVDDLAVANILAAMFGCAMFGLFLERPGSNASFWILTAVAARLIER